MHFAIPETHTVKRTTTSSHVAQPCQLFKPHAKEPPEKSTQLNSY
jgi:hypothetical protein